MTTKKGVTNDAPHDAELRFWDCDRTEKAREAIDVWASVAHARRRDAGTLTIEAIFERIPDFEWLNPRSGLKVVEPMPGPNTSSRALCPAELIYLAVEQTFSMNPPLSAMRGVLLMVYPRIGPYQQTPLGEPGSRASRFATRAAGMIERAAIEAIRARK